MKTGSEQLATSRPRPGLHHEVRDRLRRLEQRYTPARQLLVEALSSAARPLTIPELLGLHPDVPQSSAYRNVTTLIEAGVVRRVAGTDDHGRFELAEDLSEHHHHLVCSVCGTVVDVEPSTRLEAALVEAARLASEEHGFVIAEHRTDFVGCCAKCQIAMA